MSLIMSTMRSMDISIHALLAESDGLIFCLAQCIIISIHALLAESDNSGRIRDA